MAALKCDNLMRAYRLAVKTITFFLILSFAAVAAYSEPLELKLYPAKILEPAQTYRLVVPADKQKDADALPLYEQAIQLMPKDVDKKQISAWMDLPLEQFPQEQAEAVIQKYIESLRLVARASRCKNCNWPEWKPGMEVPNLSGYRDIAFVIRLWARLEISRGQYESALAAMQTAFGTARHLGQAPTTTQTTAGVVVAGLTCREIEKFVQGKNFPNLYAALADLPKPFVNIEISIENEKRLFGLVSDNAGFDRMRLMARRLDNHVNALQVVEAMRHYAATNDGQLPLTLSDIKDRKIPNDLMSGKAFQYSRTAKGATLRSVIPKNGDERDAVNYEIVIRK